MHLFATLPIGGAENLLLSILSLLNSNKYKSTVCTLGERGILANQIEGLGIEILELGLLKKGKNRNKIVNSLTDIIEKNNIDLLHCHLYHANYLGRLAAKKAKIPCIISIHNTYTNPKWHRRLINYWLAKKHTHKIIAGSQEIKQDILKYDFVSSDLIEIIPNSIDLKKSTSYLTKIEARRKINIPTNTYTIGTLGRLEKQKGHCFLIDALAILKRSNLNIKLLIIGSGREEINLKRQAELLDLTDNIFFLGTRIDIGDLFRAMDLFVMPSLWEGLSLAMLSAMAANLPVVATQVGGVKEVLGHNDRGFIVPPYDAEKLADQIIWCINNTNLTNEIALKGASFVRSNYSDTAMIKKLELIYEHALKSSEPTLQN